MNKYRLYKAGIDVDEGIERFNGSEEEYEHYLKKFLDDVSYQHMLEYMEKKDVNNAFLSAHALKGLAGNLSLDRIYVATVPFVESLRNGNLEGAERLLQSLKEAYQLTIDVIAQIGK